MKTKSFSLILICIFGALSNAFSANNLAKFSATVNIADSSVLVVNKSKSPATSYQINFGDGTILIDSILKDYTHKYTNTGIYSICMIVKDSTKKETVLDTLCQIIEIKVDTSCQANFTYSIVNNRVTFTNTSSGKYTSSSWTFGDGGVSSKKDNITHLYLKSGYYTVTLIVLNKKNACSSEVSKNVLVQDNVQSCAAFFNNVNISTKRVLFINSSIGDYNKFSWDFGDGVSSSIDSVEHDFSNPGIYNVKLIVENTLTNRKSVYSRRISIETDSIDILPLFSYEANIDSNSISFSNQTLGKNIKSYIWSFGDGSFSSDTIPTHTYSVAGDYVVCINVIPQKGRIRTSCQNIVVGREYNYIPDISFSVENRKVSFSLIYNFQPDSVKWDFSDGMYSKELEPTYTFSKNEIYLVGLKLYYAGTQKEILKIVNLTNNQSKILGRFKFESNKGSTLKVGGSKVRFKGTLSGDVSRLRFMWNFGDGTFDSTSIEPEHFYTNYGTYNVCFTVENDLTGDSDTWCDSVQVGTTVGITNNLSQAEQFSIYPNPASQFVHIEFQQVADAYISINITDIYGKRITNLFSGYVFTGKKELSYPISLSRGVYIVSCGSQYVQVNKILVVQ